MSKHELWGHKEIRAQGKAAFLRNYRLCVISSFLMSLFVPLTSAMSNDGSLFTRGFDLSGDKLSLISSVISGGTPIFILKLLGISGLVMVILNTAIFNPLKTGSARFFLKNVDENASSDDIAWIFKERYLTALAANFIIDILTLGAWCLLIFPGLIVKYVYILVPYIMADEKEINCIQALRRSRRMMRGQKWRFFVFDMSFLGWLILSWITIGIFGIFYVNPYKDCADAVLYKKIKEEYEIRMRENAG